ncbi:hypothetical protein ZHAS_00013166 [Anopheles sinensis]|uniref:Uncharacterized protein n=1 Tax=Anopheles sinensis TaxID=74873 RepID=A0A084W4Q8_ANOSI|nr:hypothetical protein ZHAS_00013166 [Anopheles sinensis]
MDETRLRGPSVSLPPALLSGIIIIMIDASTIDRHGSNRFRQEGVDVPFSTEGMVLYQREICLRDKRIEPRTVAGPQEEEIVLANRNVSVKISKRTCTFSSEGRFGPPICMRKV